jgi:hypothetical protein
MQKQAAAAAAASEHPNHHRCLEVGTARRTELLAVITADLAFLARQNIMDYSVLLSVGRRKGLRCGNAPRVHEERATTNNGREGTSAQQTGEGRVDALSSSGVAKSMKRTEHGAEWWASDERGFTARSNRVSEPQGSESHPRPDNKDQLEEICGLGATCGQAANESSERASPYRREGSANQQQELSGEEGGLLRGHKGMNEEKDEVWYRLGFVDLLQPYDNSKRFETMLRVYMYCFVFGSLVALFCDTLSWDLVALYVLLLLLLFCFCAPVSPNTMRIISTLHPLFPVMCEQVYLLGENRDQVSCVGAEAYARRVLDFFEMHLI